MLNHEATEPRSHDSQEITDARTRALTLRPVPLTPGPNGAGIAKTPVSDARDTELSSQAAIRAYNVT